MESPYQFPLAGSTLNSHGGVIFHWRGDSIFPLEGVTHTKVGGHLYESR